MLHCYFLRNIINSKCILVPYIHTGRKEGNVLLNDTLNTFYFTVIWRRTYDKGPVR